MSPFPPETPGGETIYEERRFALRICDLRLRGGGAERRGVVVHPGSVVLLPITDAREVVLVANRRWQIGRRLLELPAGTLHPQEAPAAGAARELAEETGYRARELAPLWSMYIAPGLTDEVMHVFEARGLTPVGQQLEADEDLEVRLLPLAAVQGALVQGRFHDAKT